MHFKKTAALFFGVLLTSSFACMQIQAAEPLLSQGFEDDIGKWNGMGGAKVSTATEPENVKSGQSALRFDYAVDSGQFQVLASPLAKASFSSLQSIKFWVKSDHDATVMLALQEEGGGYFATVFSLVRDKWQEVAADLDDFQLQTGPFDPKDANGKLDREKIAFVGLIDFDQVLLQMLANAPAQVAQLIHIPDGPRTLYLDDVVLSSAALAKPEEKPGMTTIDVFQRPQPEWAAIGGATLEHLQAKDPKDNALKVTYAQQPGRLTALVKPLQRGALAGKKQLSFQAASMKPTTFWLQLEETSGGKYNAAFTVPGNATPTPITLRFADFKTSPDSNDTNGRLDLEQVKHLLLVDISGMMGEDPAMPPPEMPGEEVQNENTLWLNAVYAK